VSYCERVDMLAFLPSGGLPNAARVATGNAAGDYLESDQHGLIDDQEVTVSAETGGTLPAPLVDGTTYYAIVTSTSRFQVAAAEGGAAIPLTTAGENFTFWSELPWDAWIDAAARDVDSFLPAHVVPVVAPYPQILVTANAELAALRGLMATGGATIDYGAKLDTIQTRLTRWAKALPIRGDSRSVTSPVNLAITASASSTDARGWKQVNDSGTEVIP
jgi:hypothetical protein